MKAHNQQTVEQAPSVDMDSIHTYRKEDRQKVANFRREKSIQDVCLTPQRYIQTEFDVLQNATVSSAFFDQRFRRYYMEYRHSQLKVPELGQKFHLNANELVSLADKRKVAILSSAPDRKSSETWGALYYKDVKLMVMLCPLYDDYIGIQADRYWPKVGESLVVKCQGGDIKITTESIVDLKKTRSQAEQELMQDQTYNEKKIIMEGPLGVRVLKHIHWDGWRDLGTPRQDQIGVLKEVLNTCLDQIQEHNMIWIHCFSGVGRTGTFTCLLELLRLMKKNSTLSIFSIVENVRRYRNCAVEMDAQYAFIYKFANILASN